MRRPVVHVPGFGSLTSAVQRIKTSSVIAPLLAADAISGAVALAATFRLGAEALTWLVWGPFFGCVALTLIAYVFWSFREPNRLQTEDYQLERQRLDMLGDERDPNNPAVLRGPMTGNTAVQS
jgi:hypothetical protein